jgi:hypothetical protein
MMLPEYVSAGRYLDAWLIQYSAFRMTEVADEGNPFLFEMFHHGFDEWARQLEEQQRSLMRELGIDVSEMAEMSIQEADAWVRAQMADPAKGALLEAYYEAHPMMREQVQAEMVELERESLRLLERDDADCLYLSPEEISPWVPVLMERLEPVEAQARKAAEGEDQDRAGTLEAMGKIMGEVAQEMVPAVFTPERFDQLVADLKEYWSDLLEKQEEEAARLAHLASMMLEEKDEVPVGNPLLIGMCFASLRLTMIVLSEEAQARAESGAAVE